MQYPPLTQFGQTNLANSIFVTSQPPLYLVPKIYLWKAYTTQQIIGASISNYISDSIRDGITHPSSVNECLGKPLFKFMFKCMYELLHMITLCVCNYLSSTHALNPLLYFPWHRVVFNSIVIIPPPNEVGGGVYWIHLVRPSVRLSVCPSVCRRHGFRSISQVCFGISISNFICILMVAIGRSLLIFSDVTFKMAAWRPYWIFWFPDSNFTLALNINFKLQRHNTYVYV